MSDKYFVDIIKKYPVTTEAAIKLLVDFLEYEHDSLCGELERATKRYEESKLSFLLEDIEYTKEIIQAIDKVLEYYRDPSLA